MGLIPTIRGCIRRRRDLFIKHCFLTGIALFSSAGRGLLNLLQVTADAVFGILAPFGATQVKFGIPETMVALLTAPVNIILPELHLGLAIRALHIVDIIQLPKLPILSRTL